MPVIDVSHVSKRFFLQRDRPRSLQELVVNAFKPRTEYSNREEFWALRDVSFDVNAGEAVALVGSNGSGKSTCLKLLTKIIEPTQGAVHVQGRISALLELGAGFHPELTGRENIYLSGSVLGLKRREIRRRFDSIVAFAELERFIDVPVKFYSSGMYVRLAFATATNVSPDVLLIDEVLAVGDQNFQTRCLDRIFELRAQGVTIVFVSHDMGAVRNLCDRAIWLNDGQLCEEGVADLVVAHYLRYMQEREEAAEAAALAAEAGTSATPAEAQASYLAELREKVVPPDAVIEEMLADPDAEDDTPPPESDPLAHERRHWGSHEIEIQGVRFLDGAGQPRAVQLTGEPMAIGIRYAAHQRITEPVFEVTVHRADGEHIWGSTTSLAQFTIPALEGPGELCYQIEMLPLPEGTYYLSVAVHNSHQSHTYDQHTFYYRFRVHHNTPERYYAMYFPSRWELRADGQTAGSEAPHDS